MKWILALLAMLGLFLSSWIVVPAPTMAWLPLGIGAPEIAPILLLANSGVLLMAWWSIRQTSVLMDSLAIATMGCSGLAIVFCCLPLVQVPIAIHQANVQMQTALGVDYENQLPPDQVKKMRSRPFSFLTLIQGIPIHPTPKVPIIPERRSLQTPDGTSLVFDIYRPPGHASRANSEPPQRPLPTLVTIYGGAWRSGDPQQKATFNRYMATQGYIVVAIDYRHAPEYQFPTQIEDVWTALAWIGDHADEYGMDGDRIALIGWSAGAHLAMLAAYQSPPSARSDGTPPCSFPTIRSVVNYYGPVDLTAGYRDPPVPDPIGTRAVLEAFLGGSPDQRPNAYTAASPISYVRSHGGADANLDDYAKPNLPPTLLIYGDRDHLVKPLFGRQLHQQLRMRESLSVLIKLPWAEHAFDVIFRGIGNQIALYYTERFLSWSFTHQP